MSKFSEKVKNLGLGLVNSVRQFPLETALGLVYFLLIVLGDQGVIPSISTLEPYNILLWFFPHYVLLYTLHQLAEANPLQGKPHPVLLGFEGLVWLMWYPLMRWGASWEGWSLGMAWVLAFLLLAIGHRKMGNEVFGRHLLHRISGMAMGCLLGALLVGIVEAIIGSIDALFDLALDQNWYMYPIMFVLTVVLPLLCCYFVTENGSQPGERFLRVLIDFILSPALLIYSVILYLYLFKILVKWELPEGGVAYMVLGFLAVGFLCHLLRLQVQERHFEGFFKFFPAVALAPLGLLWVGVFRRIGEYGFTEERVYLLVLCVLVTLFVAMLLKERTRNFQLMTIILGALAILFTYIPGNRALDWGIRSQEARLQKHLPAVLEEGKFPIVDRTAYNAMEPARAAQLTEAYEAWSYLRRNMRSDVFKSRYGHYGTFSVDSSGQWQDFEEDTSETQPLIFKLEVPQEVGAYTQYVPSDMYQRNFPDSEKVVFYTDDGVLLECPVKERLLQWAENPDTDVLIYWNERYMAIFRKLTVNAHTYLYESGVAVLFKKP